MNKLSTVTVMTLLLCQTAYGEKYLSSKDTTKWITKQEICETSQITFVNVDVHAKSKRQEYIEKCDKWLEFADKVSLPCTFEQRKNNDTEWCGGTPQLISIYAQIAQAYCTRVLLEDKSIEK